MKHLKKFESKKKEKESEEISFNAKSLEIEKEKIHGLGIKTEPVEHDEKELDSIKKNKIEKFESFITINIDNVDNIENIEWENEFGGEENPTEVVFDSEDDEDDNEFDAEYEEDGGCGCCDDCTGSMGCECGCEDCKCNSEDRIMKPEDFSTEVSESLKYHLDNNKAVTENIFRPGSEAFYEVLKETRKLYEMNAINLCDIDKEIYESTEIGNFGYYSGELVPLDLPMENIQELNEAEYKGKKVKLNYPMRNSGGGKKYYVYVKNPKSGNIKKISFGDVHGGLTAKVSNPEARKSFAARHKCSTKKDKTKAGYWACRINKYGHLWGGKTYPGYW